MKRLLNLTAKTLALAIVFVALENPGKGELIDFGSAFSLLPYTEAGLTFTNLGTSPAVVSSGHLVAGTNFDPIHVRVTGAAPFDLISLDVLQLFRNWQVVASTGASLAPSIGTLTFTELPGWQGIEFFDLIHDPPEANGSISADNILVQFVPEPSAAALAIVALLGLVICGRKRRARRGIVD